MPKPMGNSGKEKDSQVRLENLRKQRKWMLMREKNTVGLLGAMDAA